MSLSNQKAKDAAMAAYMVKTGQKAPNKWHGVGAGVSAEAAKMGTTWKGRTSSTWERGMMGGVLAMRCGYGDAGIPDDLK